MSTMAFASVDAKTLAAWETEGQIYYARISDGSAGESVSAPGNSKRRRFPALAANGRDVLLAWTEGLAWNKGGGLAWQVYGAGGQPLKDAQSADYGRADGVPTWSVISAVTLTDGRFAIIY